MELNKLIKAVFFDIDDTLYDQMLPFEKALLTVFPDIQRSNIENIYSLFRKKSDEVFPNYQNGIISQEEHWFQRLSQTLKVAESIKVTFNKTVEFQSIYNHYLKDIKPYKEVFQLVKELKKSNLIVGIISNGEFKHQTDKISTLGLLRYINEENIFISGNMGIAKPNFKIFSKVANVEELKTADILYIGDNYLNDIFGASNAGLKTIWFNHRRKKMPKGMCVYPNLEVKRPQDFKNVDIDFIKGGL